MAKTPGSMLVVGLCEEKKKGNCDILGRERRNEVCNQ